MFGLLKIISLDKKPICTSQIVYYKLYVWKVLISENQVCPALMYDIDYKIELQKQNY